MRYKKPSHYCTLFFIGLSSAHHVKEEQMRYENSTTLLLLYSSDSSERVEEKTKQSKSKENFSNAISPLLIGYFKWTTKRKPALSFLRGIQLGA
mmetsp:Transcript_30232/g.46256  ORF Transcript_30232/g.46256 Transcript_30232/m.46256 type:complete len:94 (+) Transcript_30232:1744-2025(+)